MKYKTFSALILLATIVSPASSAFAQEAPATTTASTTESVITSASSSSTSVEEIAPVITPAEELKSLKLREKSPETGSFMKFLFRLKIRQLENQLNVKKALQ